MMQMVALQSLAMMSFKGNDSPIETEYIDISYALI